MCAGHAARGASENSSDDEHHFTTTSKSLTAFFQALMVATRVEGPNLPVRSKIEVIALTCR